MTTNWADPPAIQERTKSTECESNVHALCSKKELCSCRCHAVFADDETEPAADEQTQQPSQLEVALDGTTGEPIVKPVEVDGKPALLKEQPSLVEVSLEALVHDLVQLDARIADVSSERGAISNRLKTLKERREELLSELKRRDVIGEQMPLATYTPPPDEEEEGDEEDTEEEF